MIKIYNSGAAQVNSGIVVARPASLQGFIGINFGPTQYVMFFDSTTVPANGALVSIPWQIDPGPFAMNLTPLGSERKERSGLSGWPFVNGIAWANSTTAPTLTIGGANMWLTAVYSI